MNSSLTERSTSRTKLIKLSVLKKNIQNVKVDLGFALKEEIKSLKKEGKVKETKLLDFHKNVKNFLHYIITSSQKYLFMLSLF